MSRHLGAGGLGKAALALFTILLSIGSLSAVALAKPARHPWPPPQPAYDVTSPREALRVDRVPAPEPDWEPCFEFAECATFPVPLDYDDPSGPQVELALTRVPARDQAAKLGSLFVNPGGPGAGARSFALEAPLFLGSAVLDRFDLIGIDPRGVGESSPIRCFGGFEERLGAWLPGLESGFPATPAQEEAAVASARTVGRGCSTTGQPLVSSMSTAEVARDMDVVRRAVGDPQLNYYGVSYGSYIGEVYANLFPDRVRAMAIDGVVEPRAMVGNPLTRFDPTFDRLRSADGSYRALAEILRRCAAVGQPSCRFAGGDPLAKYATLAARLRTTPVAVEVGGYGEVPPLGTITVDYNHLVALTHLALDYPTGWETLDAMLSSLWTLTEPSSGQPAPAAAASARRSLSHALARALAAEPEPEGDPGLEAAMSFEESLRAVVCSDSLHGPDASLWRLTGALADRRAPYFGRLWNWLDAACATNTWTARDEDAYFGPYDRRTRNPVLVVGGLWDPSTNYDSAVAVSRLMPNSRLVSSDSWGHGSYWTSDCVGRTVDNYLVTAVAPPSTVRCRGDAQPFEATAAASKRSRSGYVPALPSFGWFNGSNSGP